MERNPSDSLMPVIAQKADNWSAGANSSAAIDTRGFEHAMIIVNSGTNGSSGTVDVKVQDCATSGGSYADITGAAFTQVTEANDVAIYAGSVRLHGKNRFIKTVLTVATAACDVSVSVVLSGPQVTGDQSVSYAFDVA